MADRQRPASQGARKPPSSGAQRPPSAARPTNRPASAPMKKSAQMDLLAKEEEYKRLNAELEAKTAELVRQAEEVMREQNEVLSKPISTHLSLDIADDSEEFGDSLMPSVKQSTAKAATEKKSLKGSGKLNRPPSAPRKTAQKKKPTVAEDVAVPEDFTDFSLAKTISNMEDRVNDDVTGEQLEDDVMPSAGEEMGADDSEEFGDSLMPSVKQSTAKAATEKKSLKGSGKLNRPPSAPRKTAQKKKPTVADDVAVPEDFTDFSLAKTISNMEDRVNDDVTGEQLEDDVMPSAGEEMGAVPEDFTDFSLAKTISNMEDRVNDDVTGEQLEDDVMPSAGEEMGAEAQVRFLKAKLRVMQEELNRLSHECNKKDEENGVLSSKLKEVEEDRVRLQRTTSTQQTQLEKHRALAEDANRNCDGLRHQVTALQKEVAGMKRAQKQASSSHNATEVRLNRALEEAERSKAELNKLKQSSKDSANQEQQRIEALQAENKKLEKQKAELITGFKKQLKLIDILKRQKMHFEAARMMSFTEEEFMKALDWGKS
ncbi:hypothetical protein PGIGA_G00152370 [Pangasianodon gigas]|uniref:Uncharacterized protein n=1 Tax=Pangasianodon gigas TaxID=30993 RepID=A0ACC5XPZ4_PANGG|nr:hypothetical protein [Pangasianodon gigas]